eukprot:TRINITY_DN9370_c0_g1_i2.p2 TRINITY_DN9370_c0_g1~~TRINITY_DN9370_c0_g1_i2.p2  ORF type:complete len:174 (-),score=7.04 TRINITY_DN9370_c0_g1_i2:316-837(-)
MPMSLIIDPFTAVDISVGIGQVAKAMPFCIFGIALINAAVSVLNFALTCKLAGFPVATVHSLGAGQCTLAMEKTSLEMAFKVGIWVVDQHSLSLTLTVNIISIEDSTVWKYFAPIPLLQAVLVTGSMKSMPSYCWWTKLHNLAGRYFELTSNARAVCCYCFIRFAENVQLWRS